MSDNQHCIYFIRHAKDDSRYRGGWSLRPLIRDGDIQAAELAAQLVNEKSLNISTIISSDLPRAIQTARPTAKAMGLPVIPMRGWRETNNGKLAGMLNSEVIRRYPGMFWSSLDMDEHYPRGESPREFFTRIQNEFSLLKQSVLENKISSNVLVFTHSGVINAVYSIVRDIEWSNKTRSFDIPYTSIHKFNIEQNTIERIILKEKDNNSGNCYEI